jgi:hypothetical protein
LIVATIAAVAMVGLAGGLMASNMGFKLNRELRAADGGVTSKTGSQTLSIPYNPQVGMTDARGLFSDIAAAGGAQNLQRFLPATDTFEVYTFAPGSPNNFTLAPGVGYFVKVGPPNFSSIVVGSHDPSAVVQLNAAGGGSATGSNLLAPPYHTTAADARELFTEIGVAQNLQQFLPASDTFAVYTFAPGSPNNFPIEPGVAYFVKMSSDLPYQPSHY